MVIFVDPWHSHLLSSVWQWSSYYLFLSRLGYEHHHHGTWRRINNVKYMQSMTKSSVQFCYKYRVFLNICLCFGHIIHYNNTMNTFCLHWSSRKYWFTFKYLATFKMIILLSFFFRMRYVYLQERVKNTVSTLEARFFSKTTYDRV